MTAPARHALVVGGTGMLRGVALALAGRGFVVSVVARNARRLARLADDAARRGGTVHPVCVDWRDAAAFEFGLRDAAARHGVPELAVVWTHESAPDAPFAVARLLATAPRPTRYVHVLGSAAAVPTRAADDFRDRFAAFANVARQEVVLGFVVIPRGSRWLHDEEIAAGVLRAIDEPAPRTVVGTVEPWSARP